MIVKRRTSRVIGANRKVVIVVRFNMPSGAPTLRSGTRMLRNPCGATPIAGASARISGCTEIISSCRNFRRWELSEGRSKSSPGTPGPRCT
jgi:hypothetical protein